MVLLREVVALYDEAKQKAREIERLIRERESGSVEGKQITMERVEALKRDTDLLFQRTITMLEEFIAAEGDETGKERLMLYLQEIVKFRKGVSTVAAPAKKSGVSIAPTHTAEVHWNDIIGLDDVKEKLHDELVHRVNFPDVFVGIRPWNTLLLYGPPGTGKTMLACAICTESRAKFFSVTAGNLLSKWVGESERAVINLFSAAKASKPSVIFIDEVEGLLYDRNGSDSSHLNLVKNEFLTQMNELGTGVMVVCATNSPEVLDMAARRRFHLKVYVPLPNDEDRLKLFKKLLPPNIEGDFTELVLNSVGHSSSDISGVISKAQALPFARAKSSKEFFLRDDGKFQAGAGIPMTIKDIPFNKLYVEPMTFQDVKQSLLSVRPSVSKQTVERLEEWKREYGEELKE